MTALAPWGVAIPEPVRRTGAAGDAAGATSTVSLSTLTATLWIGVASQKIALPGNIELPLLVMGVATAFLLATGRARLSMPRLLGFVLFVAALALGQVVSADARDASVPAIAVALVLYGMLIVAVPLAEGQLTILIRRFQTLALVIAALVGVQWAFQLVGLPMPSLESILPHDALFQFYNYIQPLAWKSAYMKPNGIFMLEAAHASQLLAMALVVEICLFRRWWRVAALMVAQLATFGGTGFVLLLASIVVVPFYVRGRALAALAGLTLLIAAGASLTPVWDNFSRRSSEIGAAHTSSGRGRFVEPYLYMADRIASDRRTLISGIGPGNGKLDEDRSRQLVMNPVVKAVVEYGLLVGVVWMLFIHGCVLRSRAPLVVCFVVLVQYDFLNGALLVPIHLLYCWVLAAAHSRREVA